MAVVMAISSVVAFIVASIIASISWKHRSKSKRRQGSDNTKLLKILNSSSLNLKYSTIEKATSSFDEANKLGQGGFGTVYKSFLTEEALKAVKELLPETAEGDLASVCSLPDEIKYRYNWRWTSELHYVDTPDFRCNYDYCSLFKKIKITSAPGLWEHCNCS